MSIGLVPGFLYNVIKQHARNASRDDDRFSAVHNFLVTSAKVLHNSFALFPHLFDVNNLFQPSVSTHDHLAPPNVLSLAFQTLYALIEANLPGCTSFVLSRNNTSRSALRLGGCFYFNCCNVFSVRGRTPFFMLSVSSFIVLWMLPLLILLINFSIFRWWLMLYWLSLDISELFQFLLVTSLFLLTPKAPSLLLLHWDDRFLCLQRLLKY